MYPSMEAGGVIDYQQQQHQQQQQQQQQQQYRNGGVSWDPAPRVTGWEGGEMSYMVPQHLPSPHQPAIARRPITGNNYAPGYPRPHFTSSPVPTGPPPQPQFIRHGCSHKVKTKFMSKLGLRSKGILFLLTGLTTKIVTTFQRWSWYI